MIVVKHIFSTLKMTNWTRVLLNNALSLIFQPFFFFATRENERIKVSTYGTWFLIYCSFVNDKVWLHFGED
jgi:hypothetical protein